MVLANYITKMDKLHIRAIGTMINFVDLGEFLMTDRKNLLALLIIMILLILEKNGYIIKDRLKMTQNMEKERFG